MSKLYKKYILLKINNSKKLYLFKCGIFYIFIDEDAKVMSKELNLKLIPLDSVIMKCGFPVNSSDKYFNILKNLNYNIEIISSDNYCSPINLNNYITLEKLNSIINDFINIDVTSLSIKEAFDLLIVLQNKFKQINIGQDYNEKKI